MYPDSINEFVGKYYKVNGNHSLVVEDVINLCKEKIEKTDILLVNISGRVKTWQSTYEKLLRKSVDIDNTDIISDVKDFAGVRIVCGYENDIEKIEEIIRESFDIEGEPENRYKQQEDNTFGYFDVKYFVHLKQNHEHKGLVNICCEVQITTEAMNLWANISHLLLYKNSFTNIIDSNLKREISATSALLYIVDKQFGKLVNTWQDYLRMLTDEYHKEPENFKLREYSFETLIVLLREFNSNHVHASRKFVAEYYESTKNGYATIGDLFIKLEKTKKAIDAYYDIRKRTGGIWDIGLLRTAEVMYARNQDNGWDFAMESVKALKRFAHLIDK